MKLDCHCGGWTPELRREATRDGERPWFTIVCRCCGRRVCTDCETGDEGPAFKFVCDECWEGVCALLAVLLTRGLVRR